MTRLLALAPLLLALTVPPAAAAQTSPDARALLRLEDQWAAAVVKRDGATFQRLLAPGFVYTENDQTMSRDDVLRSVTAGSDSVTEAHNEGMQVHAYGPATAVVTGWLAMRGRGSGGPFDRRYRFTDTWVKSGGRWRIVAAHDYLGPVAAR
ncbi:MAG: nuclear transport factor 2 family protein [Gemmatimonadaceae bacterium]